MKILTFRFSCNRLASSSPSSSDAQFHHSPLKIPSSDCDFVRGVPCPSSTNSRVVEEGSEDEDLVFSVSSEELILEVEFYTEEARVQSREAEDIDSFGTEFANLFLSLEKNPARLRLAFPSIWFRSLKHVMLN